MATLAQIKERLAIIRRDLDEVTSAVEELETAATLGNERSHGGWPPGLVTVDKAALQETFSEIMRQAGIDRVQPVPAEELQALMERAGIRPEANVFSQGIVEMREE